MAFQLSAGVYVVGDEQYSFQGGSCHPTNDQGPYNGATLYQGADVTGNLGSQAELDCLNACLAYEGSTGCQFNGANDPKKAACYVETRTDMYVNTEAYPDTRGCIM